MFNIRRQWKTLCSWMNKGWQLDGREFLKFKHAQDNFPTKFLKLCFIILFLKLYANSCFCQNFINKKKTYITIFPSQLSSFHHFLLVKLHLTPSNVILRLKIKLHLCEIIKNTVKLREVKSENRFYCHHCSRKKRRREKKKKNEKWFLWKCSKSDGPFDLINALCNLTLSSPFTRNEFWSLFDLLLISWITRETFSRSSAIQIYHSIQANHNVV